VGAQTSALGQHQQRGVEEPTLIDNGPQQALRDLGANGLEAALRVAEAGAQEGP
jgi:hypothetical protein